MREVITFRYANDRADCLKSLRDSRNHILYPANWLGFGSGSEEVKYRAVGEKSIECLYSGAFLDIEQALNLNDYDVVREAVVSH